MDYFNLKFCDVFKLFLSIIIKVENYMKWLILKNDIV